MSSLVRRIERRILERKDQFTRLRQRVNISKRRAGKGFKK